MQSTINKAYFWDVNINTLDEKKSMRLIVERVLTLGSIAEINTVISMYGVENVKNTPLNLNWIDEKNLNFMSMIFDLPKTEFKCYKRKQLKTQHWNY